MGYPEQDDEFQDGLVTAVKDGAFESDGGWLGFAPEPAAQPKVGGTFRTYGKGFGYPVRGIFFDGMCNRYETQHEQEDRTLVEGLRSRLANAERWLADGRARYELEKSILPEPFQRRLARFEKNRRGFAFEYGEYEMSSCIDAVKIARACSTAEEVGRFSSLKFEDQMGKVPDLYEGHSGNTFGMACRLAHHFLSQPDRVWREHAAIAALVGCEEAGCIPDNTKP